MCSRKKQNAATISQITKCIKRNKHNVKIDLNIVPEFQQSIDFVVLRERKEIQIETSISSKSVNEDKNTLKYVENEVLDIPKKLNSFFDNALDSNYYIYGVPKDNSFFHSIMYIISKDFKLKSSKIRLDYIQSLKDNLVKEIPVLHKKNKYTKYGYTKDSIINNIQNISNETVNEGLMCAISDFFSINLIIFNYNTEKYWIGKEYCNSIDNKNVILIYSDNTYLPIIHIYGEYPDIFIYKCIVNKFTIYNKLPTDTTLSVVEQETKTSNHSSITAGTNDNSNNDSFTPTPGKPVLDNKEDLNNHIVDASKANNKDKVINNFSVETVDNQSVTNSPNKIKLKAISSYKLKDLQKLAEANKISIKTNSNKNKTKRQLYDSLSTLNLIIDST